MRVFSIRSYIMTRKELIEYLKNCDAKWFVSNEGYGSINIQFHLEEERLNTSDQLNFFSSKGEN